MSIGNLTQVGISGNNMKRLLQFLLVVTGVTGVVALEPRQSSDQTASVDLTVTRGKPEHRASGFIYGIPDNYPNQIPLHWLAYLFQLFHTVFTPVIDLTFMLLAGIPTWASHHAKAAVRSLVPLAIVAGLSDSATTRVVSSRRSTTTRHVVLLE